VRRLRDASKAPLVLAAILATPLFFVGLMAMSLAIEKPTVHHVLKQGRAVAKLADPSGTTEATIWLLALVPAVTVVLLGTAAMLIGRTSVIVTSVGAIATTIALLLPLDTWVSRHTGRYPDGVDLIPHSAGSADIYLRGEWEGTARHTALQLGTATIVIAAAAAVLSVLLEARRRRGHIPPLPPPPPEMATGQSQLVRARLGRRRF
jgi:hypothetical protein